MSYIPGLRSVMEIWKTLQSREESANNYELTRFYRWQEVESFMLACCRANFILKEILQNPLILTENIPCVCGWGYTRRRPRGLTQKKDIFFGYTRKQGFLVGDVGQIPELNGKPRLNYPLAVGIHNLTKNEAMFLARDLYRDQVFKDDYGSGYGLLIWSGKEK